MSENGYWIHAHMVEAATCRTACASVYMRNERISICASGFARGERGEVGGRSGRALRFFSPVEGGAPLNDSAGGAGFGNMRIGGGVRGPGGGGGGGALG